MSNESITVWTLLDKYFPIILPVITLFLGYYLRYYYDTKISERREKRKNLTELIGVKEIYPQALISHYQWHLHFLYYEQAYAVYRHAKYKEKDAERKEFISIEADDNRRYMRNAHDHCDSSLEIVMESKSKLYSILAFFMMFYHKKTELNKAIDLVMNYRMPEPQKPIKTDGDLKHGLDNLDKWLEGENQNLKTRVSKYHNLINDVASELSVYIK